MDSAQLLATLNSATDFWKSTARSDGFSPSEDPSLDTERTKLLTAARKFVSVLEVPQKAMLELSKAPVGHAALRTALMLNLFENWTNEDTKTAEELAKKSGAEELLIIRIMRALVGIGIFEEIGKCRYTHNILSHTLVDPVFRTLIVGMSATASLTMAKLPEYLASINYRNPDDPENALFHYALDTRLNIFQWLKTHPDQLAIFGAYNAAATKLQGRTLRNTISALFPREYNLNTDRDHVLLVDVGAGRGQALKEVRWERRDLVGRMIAQDLPEVIAGREEVDGVENMVYDFFEPQPVKGASVYFLCHILHDWPDSACRRILRNTISALEAGVSRLVIVDQVLPNTNAPAFSGLMDLSMMTFGGMERTERQWRVLLEGVGLTILNIEPPEVGSLSRDGTIVTILYPQDRRTLV